MWVFTGRLAPKPATVLFDRICLNNGIRHLLTAPYSPTTTGKVERFHRTLRKDFFAGKSFETIEEMQSALDVRIVDYNNEREPTSPAATGHRSAASAGATGGARGHRRRCRGRGGTGVQKEDRATRFDTAYGAFDRDQLVGVGVWLPPGRFPWSATRKLRAAAPFLMVLAAAPRNFRAFVATGRRTEEIHPTEPRWYLEVMGVDPSAQRRGVGRALLGPVLAESDASGTPCYLETADENNISYYERYGFDLLGPVQLVPGGPPHWAMLRHPRPATTGEQA